MNKRTVCNDATEAGRCDSLDPYAKEFRVRKGRRQLRTADKGRGRSGGRELRCGMKRHGKGRLSMGWVVVRRQRCTHRCAEAGDGAAGATERPDVVLSEEERRGRSLVGSSEPEEDKVRRSDLAG